MIEVYLVHGRGRSARFPARKTLEELDFTFQRSVKKTLIQHLVRASHRASAPG